MNTRRGTTLIETLLYLGILSAVLLAVSAFLGLAWTVRTKARTMTDVDQAGTAAMRAITQAVRNATSVRAPAAGTSGNSLELEGAAPGGGATVFDVADGVLRVSEDGGEPVPLTDGNQTVLSFLVSEVSGTQSLPTVHIEFEVYRDVHVGRNEYQYARPFSGTAVLRTRL